MQGVSGTRLRSGVSRSEEFLGLYLCFLSLLSVGSFTTLQVFDGSIQTRSLKSSNSTVYVLQLGSTLAMVLLILFTTPKPLSIWSEIKNKIISDMVDDTSGDVAMDFTSVVESARLLYLKGKQTCANTLSEPVYGRICTSRSGLPPAKLTADPTRKTAFIFGSDAITSIVLRNNPYDTLLRLGFTRDYLYYDVRIYARHRQDFYIAFSNRLLYRSAPAGFFSSNPQRASVTISWSLPPRGMGWKRCYVPATQTYSKTL